MEYDATRLSDKVQELGDIELAALLCLITEEHCIIEAETRELESVEQELRLVMSCGPNEMAQLIECRFARGLLVFLALFLIALWRRRWMILATESWLRKMRSQSRRRLRRIEKEM